MALFYYRPTFLILLFFVPSGATHKTVVHNFKRPKYTPLIPLSSGLWDKRQESNTHNNPYILKTHHETAIKHPQPTRLPPRKLLPRDGVHSTIPFQPTTPTATIRNAETKSQSFNSRFQSFETESC